MKLSVELISLVSLIVVVLCKKAEDTSRVKRSCLELWDNTCSSNSECCSNYCYTESNWLTGVCKPGNEDSSCKGLWDNSCKRNTDCCSSYCYKESRWAFGVCKPGSGGSAGGTSTSSSGGSFVNHIENEIEDDDFLTEGLKVHNKYRKRHGVQLLELSRKLSRYAQEWAEELIRTNQFEHRQQNEFGENLYYFYSSDRNEPDATARHACDAWYNEIKDYTFGVEPRSTKTGHFTQMIWKKTRLVGMGRARSSVGDQIIVANYYPHGNVIGEYSHNVPPPI